MTTRYFRAGEIGLAYETVDGIAAFLRANPQHIEVYQASMVDLARAHQAWGDYQGMREEFNFLVDVLMQVEVLNKSGEET